MSTVEQLVSQRIQRMIGQLPSARERVGPVEFELFMEGGEVFVRIGDLATGHPRVSSEVQISELCREIDIFRNYMAEQLPF